MLLKVQSRTSGEKDRNRTSLLWGLLVVGRVDRAQERRKQTGLIVHDGDEENDGLTGSYAKRNCRGPGACLGGGGVTDDSGLLEVGLGGSGLGKAHKHNELMIGGGWCAGKGDVGGVDSGNIDGDG